MVSSLKLSPPAREPDFTIKCGKIPYYFWFEEQAYMCAINGEIALFHVSTDGPNIMLSEDFTKWDSIFVGDESNDILIHFYKKWLVDKEFEEILL